jgi:phage I-like protein
MNKGARTSWLKVLPTGSFHVGKKQPLEIDPEFIATLATQTNALIADFADHAPVNASPYQLPVLREHRMDGEVEGSILAAKVDEDVLYLHVSWNADAWQKVLLNKMRFVSVRFDSEYVTAWGSSYGPVIREVSVTSSPRLDNIGTIQDTLSLQLSRKEGESKMEEMIKALMEGQLAIIEGQQAMAGVINEIAAKVAGPDAPAETPPSTEEAQEAIDEQLSETPEEEDEMKEELARIKQELSRVTAEIRSQSSRLNRLNPGSQAAPVAPVATKPRSYDDVEKLGRSKGLVGASLADFTRVECGKLGIPCSRS